jgi:hypothetical protein
LMEQLMGLVPEAAEAANEENSSEPVAA